MEQFVAEAVRTTLLGGAGFVIVAGCVWGVIEHRRKTRRRRVERIRRALSEGVWSSDFGEGL